MEYVVGLDLQEYNNIEIVDVPEINLHGKLCLSIVGKSQKGK